jgi:hypothetical protein
MSKPLQVSEKAAIATTTLPLQPAARVSTGQTYKFIANIQFFWFYLVFMYQNKFGRLK